MLSTIHKFRQFAFSIPGYFNEFRDLQSAKELYRWIYFKCPNLLPLRSAPTYVSVEPTNMCNLSCPHCWRNAMDRPVGAMNVDIFAKVVEQASAVRPSLFKLGGCGEPALHPQFPEIMTILASASLRVFVYTNGTLLKRFAARQVATWPFDTIVVSVDGLDAANYERIKRGSRYDAVKQSIADFVDWRRRNGLMRPRLEVRHVLMPDESATDILSFRRAWLETADAVRFNYLEPPSGYLPTEDPSPPKCKQIRREMFIQWDGRVRLCGGYRSRYIGTVEKSTIRDLWHHPELQYIRQCNSLRRFDQVPLCKKCCNCR